jgi:dienelactone hydrolase
MRYESRYPRRKTVLALGLAWGAAAWLAPVRSLSSAVGPLPASAFPFVPASSIALDQDGTSDLAGGVRVENVHIEIGGATVRGRFIIPPESGRHPGVLFVHWLGDDAATTNLTEFSDEATRLARAGIVSLSIDAEWAQPNWFDKIRTTDDDYRDSLVQVAQLRGALDVLGGRDDVDPSNLAVVGHDFGAMYAALLAGLDDRPRFYVFVAGTTSFADWFLLGRKPANVKAYRAQLAPLDPLPYLRESHGQDYLFQFALHDKYVSLDSARAFFDASPAPKSLSFYDTGHACRTKAAVDDRVDWLIERLVGRA